MLKKTPLIKFGIFLAVMVILFSAARVSPVGGETVYGFFEGLSFTAKALLYTFLYIICGIFLWHLKDPLKIIGAIFFGAWLSTLFIYLAELVESSVFFFFSRRFGKDFVGGAVKGRSRSIYSRLGGLDFKWVFMLRFFPLIPYRILDPGFGLSGIPFKKYFTAVVIASPARIFFHQFPLSLLRDLDYSELTLALMSNPAHLTRLLYERITAYFSTYPLVFILFFIYVILAFKVIMEARRKFKDV